MVEAKIIKAGKLILRGETNAKTYKVGDIINVDEKDLDKESGYLRFTAEPVNKKEEKKEEKSVEKKDKSFDSKAY